MTNKHEFSPILEPKTFQEALQFITVQGLLLAKKILGEERPIDTVTIFTHSLPEHAFLDEYIRQFGKVSNFTHGSTLYIDTDLSLQGQTIKLLGVRAPDSTRTELGYVDYPADDYETILKAGLTGVQEVVSGRGQKLLELRHPKIDVRGYLVDAQKHDS